MATEVRWSCLKSALLQLQKRGIEVCYYTYKIVLLYIQKCYCSYRSVLPYKGHSKSFAPLLRTSVVVTLQGHVRAHIVFEGTVSVPFKFGEEQFIIPYCMNEKPQQWYQCSSPNLIYSLSFSFSHQKMFLDTRFTVVCVLCTKIQRGEQVQMKGHAEVILQKQGRVV